MYIPKLFKNENLEEVKDFIHQNGFGILIGQVGNKILATHIPLILTVNKWGNEVLTGHIAKANPQLREIEKHDEVLVIFQGHHAYISSSWYDHENVPTWNYVAVHVYGKIKILEGDELLQSIKKLVDTYEAGSENPISTDTMSADFLHREMKGLTGFEISIETIDAAKKLSQNRDDKNYNAIISELEKRKDENSDGVAGEMKKLRPKSS